MEHTPRWVHTEPSQLSQEHYELGLSPGLELQIATNSQGWTYHEVPTNNSDASVSIPANHASYQPAMQDSKVLSPVYSHPQAAFNPASGSLVMKGGWVPHSPLGSTVYGEAPTCTLSSVGSSQSSPTILSPSISDHWAYNHFTVDHTYGGVSMNQPNSPVVSIDFDVSDPRQRISATYFTGILMPGEASPSAKDPSGTPLSPSTTQLDIETKSTRHRRVAGKGQQGQQPPASTKKKTASRSGDGRTGFKASTSSSHCQHRTGENHPSLRTATRRHQKTTAETLPKPGESAEDQRARENHNQVEKEYRNRLHKGFEDLLEALYGLPAEELATARYHTTPASGAGKENDNDDEHMVILGALLDERNDLGLPGRIGTGGKGKKKQRRISKAEVLNYTCRVLKSMGDGNQKLKKEVRELRMQHDKRLEESRK